MPEEPNMRQDISGSYNPVVQGSGNATVNVNNMYAAPSKKWLKPARQILSRAFVGRQSLRDSLVQELVAGADITISGTPIAHTLHGMGGIGKTYLALQLAIELYDGFPGGVIRIDIGPQVKDEADAQRPLRKLASYAFDGVAPPGQLEPELVASWLDEMAPGRLLVIFDDVWYPVPLRLLARALPPKAVRLMTTRLTTLSREVGGKMVRLDHLSLADGLALLEERLHCKGDSRYRSSLEMLVTMLGGHALALDIFAARVQSPSHLVAELHNLQQGIGRGVLDGLTLSSGQERDENVEKTLALSYIHMQPEQQQRFRALGVFADEAPITAQSASAIWDMDDAILAQNYLFELVNMALLTEVEETASNTIYYRQHSLLRLYARALSEKEGELAETALRYAQYYVDLSWQLRETWDYNLLDQEIQNLLAALRWTDGNAPLLLADLVDALDHFLLLRGHFALLETYLPKAIDASVANKVRRANVLVSLGDLERRLGNIDEARTHYDAALPLYRTERDRLGEANVLKSLGDLENRLGNIDEARTHYDAALPLYRTERDRLGEANLYMSMGDMFLAQEKLVEARTYYEQALPLYEVERDPLGQANTLIDLGRVRFELGDQLQGLHDVEQAAVLFRFVQDFQWAAYAEQDLAEMQRKLKDNG